MIGVVITAAGASSRFGGSLPKVFAPLAGRRVIDWTLAAWSEALLEEPHELIVTLPRVHRSAMPESATVEGGDTRQASVRRGYEALSKACDVVLVHDGARPLIRAETIRAAVKAIRMHGAAAVVTKTTNSLHRLHESLEGPLIEPIPRQQVVAAQTPQGARRSLLDVAWKHADASGEDFTDEASALRSANIDVWPVYGISDNIKITTQADLVVAEALMTLRLDETHEAPA